MSNGIFFFFFFLFRFDSLFGLFVNNGNGKRLGGCTRKAVDYRKDRVEKNEK